MSKGVSIESFIKKIEPYYFDTAAESLKQLFFAVDQLKNAGYEDIDISSMVKSICKKVDSDKIKIAEMERKQQEEWEAEQAAEENYDAVSQN